ncbi:MAG: ATP-binding cassette domain-containing protein, partial [Candidatus Saccharimonadales bacterium]
MLVELVDIRRSFGQVRALANVTLALQPGTVGLVGNNGAGKSTLLKILLGLLRPDAGHGTILGCELARAGRRLRGLIGYMPESSATVPLLRGVEFVAFSGELYGMPRRDARRRAHEVLG